MSTWNKTQTSKKIIVDNDVEESYLAEKELELLPDFSKYKFLKRLYLNNNKILHLNDGLKSNYILNELYLQNNKLINISGCLQHLTCLQILLLHSNQLTDLADVVYELRYMRSLKILNLFNNPLAQEYDYRNYVVHHMKSLELFDRKAVTQTERNKIFQTYGDKNEMVKQTIAFGTHVPKTDEIYNNQLAEYSNRTQKEFIEEKRIDGAKHTEVDMTNGMPKEEQIQKLTDKRMEKYSPMRYRVLGWEEILNAREKRCESDGQQQAVIYNINMK